jgi:hypothetical protein
MSTGRVLDVFRAAFAPNNPSSLRLEGMDRSPTQMWRDGVMAIQVSPAGFERLVTRLEADLATDAQGQPQLSPLQSGDGGVFFRSRQHFSLIHICNHWTAENLNAAGLAVTPVIDTVPAGLVADLKLRNHLKP